MPPQEQNPVKTERAIDAGQPIVNDVTRPQPPVQPTDNSMSKRRFVMNKKILIIMASVAALALVVAGGLYLFGHKPLTYKKTDLQFYRAGSYTAATPKQWQDVSDQQAFVVKLSNGDKSKDIKNFKIHAYKYDPKIVNAKSYVVTADVVMGIDDATFKKITANDTYKKQFEESLTKDFATNNSRTGDCQTLSNSQSKVEYDVRGYVILLSGSLECTLKPDAQKRLGYKNAHFEISVGIKNGNGYIGILGTGTDDWTRNKDFYLKELMPAFKPN